MSRSGQPPASGHSEVPADLLAPYRDLQHSEAPQRDGLLIAEGAENVRWLLQSRLEVLSLLGKETYRQALTAELAGRVPAPPFLTRSPAEISAVVGYPFTRGVLACARRPLLPELHPFLTNLGPGPAGLVLLDGVHDHANVGATLRNARCFGLRGAILAGGCGDPWFRKTVRVSVGHVFHLPLTQHGDPADAVAQVRGAGFTVIAAHRGPLSRSLRELGPIPSRWCLVLGNEDRGPQPATIAACDRVVAIPMATDVDSLNVAAAGAVLMYALTSGASA